MLTFRPAPVIIVEGIFVFYFPELSEKLDLKIFLEAKEYLRIKRRLVRDKTERGYEMEEVLYQYENHVAPTYEKFIAPYRDDADIVVPNNTHFGKALEIVKVFVESKLKV
jgi:uridine kinase